MQACSKQGVHGWEEGPITKLSSAAVVAVLHPLQLCLHKERMLPKCGLKRNITRVHTLHSGYESVHQVLSIILPKHSNHATHDLQYCVDVKEFDRPLTNPLFCNTLLQKEELCNHDLQPCEARFKDSSYIGIPASGKSVPKLDKKGYSASAGRPIDLVFLS